ncbi:hypothetical protein FH609_016005 [Streptomyces sp. 3MP-14]|uniref:Integral membrane protein n=1 Tax=Streptomyces mimosae TaxID=2586635 RepID=A0A5N6ABF4_9ACTN|nr:MULTISPECIES: hypothetical protein [Streptomyces]KAB8165100.1 hypothetical protein FH607_013330 [Streptomyces mimosae]KAB8175732.1 hypothetical protein FH609_016005 [Streptomyces sp. 3MP-14]
MSRPADPVRSLLAEHGELCRRAVDPLEIAAGLEAGGVDEATVARCRHRDLFSLAEELHARAPRTPADAPPVDPVRAVGSTRGSRLRPALPLLPGAVCAGGLWLAHRLPPEAATGRAALGVACAVLTLLAVLVVLARRSPPGAAGLLALPPVGFALVGDAALGELLVGPQADTGSPAGAALLLALSVAPIAWCGDAFTGRALALLRAPRLREFTAAARALLLRTCLLLTLGLAAPAALLWLARPPWAPLGGEGALATAALAWPLGLAALLVRHGQRALAAGGLALVGGVELTALALASAGWLPGCGALAEPVAALVAARGVAAVPLLACAAGGCWLLVGAAVALPRASAHRPVPPRPVSLHAPHDRWDHGTGARPARSRAHPSANSPARATAPAVAAPFTCEEHDTR